MKNQTLKLVIAVILYNGFFACNPTPKDLPILSDSAIQVRDAQRAKRLSRPFNCNIKSDVPLGFIDTSWIYQNPGLGIKFTFPKGFNAIDDIRKSRPTFVRVGGDYSEFREIYLKPRSSKFKLMVNEGWSDPRFLFGFTHLEQPPYRTDVADVNYRDSVYAMVALFYADFPNEKALYSYITKSIVTEMKQSVNRRFLELNLHIADIRKEKIASDSFYTHTINIPVNDNMVLHTATSIKQVDCLYLALIYRWYSEKQHDEILKGFNGLELLN
ncbi:MAG: hypothetical protein V4717_06690 [Bacteroidota bacterium]